MKAILFFVTVSFLLSGCDAIQDLSSEASEWLAESRKQREAIAQQREQNSQRLKELNTQLNSGDVSDTEKERLRIEQERLRVEQERLQREENQRRQEEEQRRQEEQQREAQRRADEKRKAKENAEQVKKLEKACNDVWFTCRMACYTACKAERNDGVCNQQSGAYAICKSDCLSDNANCKALISR